MNESDLTEDQLSQVLHMAMLQAKIESLNLAVQALAASSGHSLENYRKGLQKTYDEAFQELLERIENDNPRQAALISELADRLRKQAEQ